THAECSCRRSSSNCVSIPRRWSLGSIATHPVQPKEVHYSFNGSPNKLHSKSRTREHLGNDICQRIPPTSFLFSVCSSQRRCETPNRFKGICRVKPKIFSFLTYRIPIKFHGLESSFNNLFLILDDSGNICFSSRSLRCSLFFFTAPSIAYGS